jgi:hypothetical protein
MATAITFVTLTQIGVIGAAALGCATASREIGHDEGPTIQSPSASVALDGPVTWLRSRTGDALTAVELSAVPGLANATAYDAVVRLRPGFLHPRDARTGTIAGRGILPAVFVDGVYYGGLEDLRGIAAAMVAEMHYVRSFDAVHRYGPDYRAGVILVRLRRR